MSMYLAMHTLFLYITNYQKTFSQCHIHSKSHVCLFQLRIDAYAYKAFGC